MKSKSIAELKSSPVEMLKLYAFERFDDDSGYKATVDLVSKYFSCAGKDLYFDDLKKFYFDLNEGHENLSGSFFLHHRYEEDHIKFEFTSFGHIVVSGAFHEYSEKPQLLEFSFGMDQTYLPSFIKQLGIIIHEIHS